MDNMPEITIDTTVTTAKKSLKSAGSLIAKKTERTKLATVTIPRAFAELGKAVYKDLTNRQGFTDLFGQLDSLLAERKKIQEDAKARPSASTFADKALKAASDAGDMAKTKAVDLKAYQVFAKLGESAFMQSGKNAGPIEIVEPLVTAIARRDLLDREMARIEDSAKGQWITPRRLVIGGGALLALMVLASVSNTANSPRRSPDQQTRGVFSEDEGGSTASENLTAEQRRYKDGWDRGVSDGKAGVNNLQEFIALGGTPEQVRAVRGGFRKIAEHHRDNRDAKVAGIVEQIRVHGRLVNEQMLEAKAFDSGMLDGYLSVVGEHMQ